MNFWTELRRRRVYRLAGLYIVGAWLIIQVADISFPAWGVPETALKYLFIAAAACFPIALIFSWYYDITTSGIVRTRAAHADETVDLPLRRADYIVLAALLGIGMAVLLSSADKIQEEIEAGPAITLDARWRENSIAVLPFTNLDINADTGFFSDGITEEILHRLASLGALHVLASNSSFAFRDSEESPAEIREKLGVRYLLQGSIRREDDTVRVTARLIDEGGFQLWSESFDRKLEGIFAIQTEIASTVASEIINEIVPLEELPAGRTTTNMEAYNEFLVGKAFFDARTLEWREQAVQAFERAIELDSGFAPPRAGLAMAITVNTTPGPIWREARQLAEKALQLDPDLAEAHAALGLIHMGAGRLNQSTLSSRRALKLDPSLGFAYNILAAALDGMGRADEANDAREKGLAVDPLNPPLVANMASGEARAGNFDRAEQLLMRLVSLPQPPPLAFYELDFQYGKQGRFAEAVAIAKKLARLDAPSGDTGAFDLLAWAYGNLGMTGDADYWAGLVLDNEQDDLGTLDLTYNLLRTRAADSELGAQLELLVNQTEFLEGEHHPWTLAQFGLVNIQVGNFEKGAEQLDYGIRLMQTGPNQTEPVSAIDIPAFQADPADVVYVMHLLAFALQEIGDVAAANDILQALADEFGLEDHALHQALLGNTEGALHILQTMTGSGWSVNYGPGKYYEIINDPAWAETIKAPEFQALLGEMKVEVDRQRAIVEAADAEHNFRAEIEQLLAK
jgi:TolB-like protein/cytochrome c-type biogenesis protein CcmH/NrfG